MPNAVIKCIALSSTLALCGTAAASAQQAKQFWHTARGGVSLGQGFSLITGNLINSTRCVSFTPRTFPNVSSLHWDITRTTSLSEYTQSGGISVQAAFTGATAKYGGEGSLYQTVRRAASQESVIVNVAMARKEDAVYEPSLSAGYTVRGCGTHYVSRILYGGFFQFEASSDDKSSASGSHSNGTVSFSNATGDNALLAFFSSSELKNQLQIRTQSFSSAGLRGTPDIRSEATVADAAAAIQAYIVAAVHDFENRRLDSLTPAAIELTPYSQISVNGQAADVVEPLMDWVDYMIALSIAEAQSALYFDGSDLKAEGAQGVIAAERARSTKLVDQGFASLRDHNSLPADLLASPPAVPEPGFSRRLDATDPSNSIECRAGANDARLVRVRGHWTAGPGQPRHLCENSSSGMFCSASGFATSFMNALDVPERSVFGVSNGGSMTIYIRDAGDYTDNIPSEVWVDCLPAFSEAKRREALTTFR